jgi:hypothetical protein
MLLTERWRDDPIEASIDPNHDGNAFSFCYWSRLDIHLANGSTFDCEDLRDGCAGMVPESEDGYPGVYRTWPCTPVPTRSPGRAPGCGAAPARTA